MIYVAIDPGGTTGVAVFEDGEIRTKTLPIKDVILWLDSLFSVAPIAAIAIEKFATAGRLSKYGLETIDLVGQIKGWAFCRDVNVYLYVPQSRKGFQEHKHPTPHQDDAEAHLRHLMADLKLEVT